jgi:hypothetical protein
METRRAVMPPTNRAPDHSPGIGARIVRVVFGISFALILIEGTCSIIYLLAKAWLAAGTTGERHTRFDPELGWVSIPNLNLPDNYGPGIYLRTNSQGFRNDHDFSAREENGRRRIVCSGDSFTFGYGVDNDHTWCQLLQGLDPSLEAVNMGQGGYGIDQSYLWYRREGVNLQHSIHLFAFIALDFGRMASSSYLGAPKPQLVMRGGRLEVTRTPLPRPSPLAVARSKYEAPLQTLASVRLVTASVRRLGFFGTPEPSGTAADQVARGIFRDLSDLDRKRGSRLVLVFLPRQQDFECGQAEHWRQLVADTAAAARIHFFDLFEDFRRLDPTQVDRLFIQPGSRFPRETVGHYSVAGNAWVAQEINERLKNLAPHQPDRSQGQ